MDFNRIREWPVLRRYDSDHLSRISLPLGGIGTGTISLSGRGGLRDWEIMNKPAKGFNPRAFFALFTRTADGQTVTRALEGPLELYEYEGASGSPVVNHGLPRFAQCSFGAAYPLGQVFLADSNVPVRVTLQAFNPLVPPDADASGIPVMVLRFVLTNPSDQPITAAVCGVLPNIIGTDSATPNGAKMNRNEFRRGDGFQGVYLYSAGVNPAAEQWGTLALAAAAQEGVSARLAWVNQHGGSPWGSSLLDFWDDFSADGQLDARTSPGADAPTASLAVRVELAPREVRGITFMLAWHFPNRTTWTQALAGSSCCGGGSCCGDADRLGNYYTVQYRDAWDVLEKTFPRLNELEDKTLAFVNAVCQSTLPEVVKEAALFNLSTLRSQTAFRTPDGRFYGWEGCNDQSGCCHGSCTHVWNYEQATAYLFGGLSQSMREVEFAQATDERGLMSFRVNLPLARAKDWGFAAADGQMGCIMKMYRDWQLSGDDAMLRGLWPQVKKAIEFCWIPGGWDGDQDGVMEGCQHNTMDVEYYGPNPQMEGWYLGALRAGEEMARYLGETEFAVRCRKLFEQGGRWTDANLFNGEYYEHHIQAPLPGVGVAKGLQVGMGARDPSNPDYQLGRGCLVDQLVGQYMAHVCGLGYLLDADNVHKTLESILKYNHLERFSEHFNCMRSYVLGDEAALLMAAYPGERPEVPFPYFTEVMTGFEYTAAVGMLYEGMLAEGLKSITDIRERYDGRKRSPFDEAECGHHYARAMASWAAVLALSGFHYSAVEKSMTFSAQEGSFFWSNGSAWGMCRLQRQDSAFCVELSLEEGALELKQFSLSGLGEHVFESPLRLKAGEKVDIQIG